VSRIHPGAQSGRRDRRADIDPQDAPLTSPELTENRFGLVNWMFRSRTTGRITLVQLPNWPLAAWVLASVVMWLGHPQRWVHAVLVVLAPVALALWAGDEVLHGVNPFRRLLGVAVVTYLGFSL